MFLIAINSNALVGPPDVCRLSKAFYFGVVLFFTGAVHQIHARGSAKPNVTQPLFCRVMGIAQIQRENFAGGGGVLSGQTSLLVRQKEQKKVATRHVYRAQNTQKCYA